MNAPVQRVVYEFAGFRADPVTRKLYAGTEHLALTPKAFDTLLVLIASRGNIVSKDELIDAIWAGTAVEENNLTQQIAALRRCFGEKAGDHRFIVTLPGKGYSFVAMVSERAYEADELTIFESTSSTVTIDIDGGVISRLRAIVNRNGSLGAMLAAAYILVVCAMGFWPATGGAITGSHTPTVAVLGFRASDPLEADLGAGIRDTLRARIGQLRDVELIPTRYGTPPDDVIIAAKEVNADVVITGSVQRNEDRIRIALEMVDVRRQRVVWGRTFDDGSNDRFRTQDTIVTEVLNILGTPPLS